MATYNSLANIPLAVALRKVAAAFAVLVLTASCGVSSEAKRYAPVAGIAAPEVAEEPPVEEPTAEIRGVWLTTNMGLDWPAGATTPDAQRKALTDLLDRLSAANFNLVIFQVQANGDALWPSSRLPAMADVTGDGSRRLDYDVCRLVIDECHRRHMECHAWIVPFRMGTPRQVARYKANPVPHPGRVRRKQCVSYHGTLWLDPGVPDNRHWLVDTYRELVRAYDFDGINLDYTRYPGGDFPDGATYRRYAAAGTSLADWRRNNISSFVADLYDMVADERPDMTVGSAPIGTYKNVGKLRNSTAYDSFFQDPVEWITSGHHGFIAPQMYWDESYGYSANLATWATAAADYASVAAGLAAYKMMDAGWSVDVIVDQIEKARRTEGIGGVVFFRADHVVGTHPKAQVLYRRLADELFAAPAPLPWASAEPTEP